MILGIIGSVMPAMPGPILGFLGIIFLHYGKPDSVSISSLIVFGSIVVFLLLIDYFVPIFGAKFSGASKRGLFGAFLGSLIGLVYFPPLGIFVGAFLGAVAGELIGGKKGPQALKAGVGTLVGSASMIILQTIFSLFLAVYFFIKLFS
ncbi:MAG: DUF456 domain-containing protein [Patescibacteria group bacterium]|nr:DUF456 domain-containing protein [Patescibacteria group bacterium]